MHGILGYFGLRVFRVAQVLSDNETQWFLGFLLALLIRKPFMAVIRGLLMRASVWRAFVAPIGKAGATSRGIDQHELSLFFLSDYEGKGGI
jgi:hypothetical protein